MINTEIQRIAVNGVLPSHIFPGGYPLYYFDELDNVLCPDCANKHDHCNGEIVECAINWENKDLPCDNCYKRIEYAYTDIEE